MANKDAILSVKVFIQATGASKVFRFGSDMSVAEALNEIHDKSGAGGKDHGLFLPPNKETGKKGAWLARNRALRFYGISSNMTIEYKKKHRPLRIKLMDDTTKVVVIDDSQNVRAICDQIGEKLGLKAFEEFSLRKPLEPGMAKAPKWLNEQQTLHEQDITEDEELVYCKKFFFSDDNIDKDDPFTLHLLYVEANKAIVDGKYPCTATDAKDFATLQMQIVYGDHDPNKHKPGFIDPNVFLPISFRKDKKVEKDILRDHKKLVGMKEMNAKYRYVQLVRSLKTYGITFFECTEKPTKAKAKAAKIWIGVTRDKILKVNPETQETVKSWTLEQMRRWSFAHGTFTLDFGDYEDDYLTLLTEEGEAMSQLIAGYIDIILKTRVDTERVVEDDDDDVAEVQMMDGQFGIANVGMTHSFSNPYGQAASQGGMMDPGSQQARKYPGGPGQPGAGPGGMHPGAAPGAGGVPPSSRVNVVDMGSAVKCTRLVGTELAAGKGKFGAPGRLTAEEWQKQFKTHKANVEGKVGELMASAKLGPSSLNRNQLDGKAKDLALEMRNMAAAARNLAELDDENIPLMDGSKAMADTVSDLLELMMKAVDDPNTPGFLEALAACDKMLSGANYLVSDPKLCDYADKGAQLLMLECINDVDMELQDICKTLTQAASQLPAPKAKLLKDEIDRVNNVKGFAIGNLKNLAPRALDPNVERQLIAAGTSLNKLSMDLVGKTKHVGIPPQYDPILTDAADRIDTALKNLLNAAKTAESRGVEGNLDIHTPVRALLNSLATLRSNINDPTKVVEAVKGAASAQNSIISVAKSLAAGSDPATKDRLMNSANNISKSIKDLMNDARIIHKNPDDLTMQGKVIADVGRLEGQCQELLSDAGGITSLNNLRYNSKASTAAIMKLATSCNIVGPTINDKDVRAELLASAKSVQGSLASLLSALQGAAKNPNDHVKQSELLEAARNQIPNFSDLVSKSKKAARFIDDLNKKQDVTYASNETSDALKLLMKAVNEVSDGTGETDIENALQEFDSVRAELETAEFYAHQGLLTPIPGQTRENAQELLKMAADTLNGALDDLGSAAKQGGKLPEHVKQAAAGMAQVASAARSMASTITDRNQQKRIVGSAKTLSDNTLALISLGRTLAVEPKNPEKRNALDKGRATYDATLGNLLEAMHGLDAKDVNKAIEDIQREAEKLSKKAPTRMGYKDASEALQSSGKALSAAVSQLTSTARLNPNLLSSSAKMTGHTTAQLIQMCTNAASSAPDQATADAILAAAKALADSMAGLLNSAKMATAKRSPDALNALSASENGCRSAIDDLVNTLGNVTSPEAENSINRIMLTIGALDAGTLEVIPGNREDLLNEFLATSKDLARVTGSLVSSARVSAAKLGLFSKEASSTVKNLLTTAKAATISDGSSASMSLDGARIVKGSEFIIENPQDTKRVLGCAKKITQAGSKLINNAKEYAKAEPDKNKRAAVVKNAQLVVNFATQLAQASRNASKKTPEAIKALTDCAQQLKDHTVSLEQLMRPPASAGNSSQEAIDPKVAHQLLSTSRTIAVATTDLIRASAAVSANQDNEVASDALKSSTRTVTESLQQLIKVCSALNPGVQECERAIQVIVKASADLDAASISATVGNLVVPGSSTASPQQAQNDTSASCKQLVEDLKALVNSSGGSSKDLVNAALLVQKSIPQLVTHAKLVAATTNDRANQGQVLSGAKSVTDSFGDLLKAVKNVNINDKESITFVNQKANEASENIGLLLGQLQSGVQLQTDMDTTARAIHTKMQELAKPAGSTKPYQDCREDLNASARELAAVLTQLLNVDKRNIGQVGLATARVGETLPKLIDHARQCVASTRENDAKKLLLDQTKGIGENTIKMIGTVKALIAGKNAQPQLRQAFGDTSNAISNLLSAAKKGAVGEVMMDKAIEGINNSITKINTSSIFAQAGQLDADKAALGVTLGKLQEELQSAANNVAQTSALISKAARGNDEDLGKAAEQLAQTIAKVAEASTKTSSRMADNISQQDVLSSAKTLGIASHQLILAAKDAQRLPNDNTAQQTLAASQNAIGESVNNLVAAVQRSSAEAQRGERELENTKQQILSLLKNPRGDPKATPEEVVSAAREVLKSTSDLVFAGNQTEIIEAGKGAVDSIQKLLFSASGAAKRSPDQNIQRGITTATENIAKAMCGLIEVGKLDRASEATQPKLEAASASVTTSVNGLVDALRKLPNAQNVSLEEKGDLDKLAEEELLKCAETIKNAAKLLANAKPAPKEKKVTGVIDQMDINNAIIDAATAIANATGTLVSHAYDAQKERVANKTKPGAKRYQNDPTWANGLISASHNVAHSVQSLVGAANKAADGKAEEEELVATARNVASATAHLVSASKAKADPNSQSQHALGAAAKAVANATSLLVSAANKASAFQDKEEEVDMSTFQFGGAAGKAKELEQQMRILKLEKELESERKRMGLMRKAKYDAKK